MRITGLDLETTGLNPQTDKIIEIGLATWDTELDAIVNMESYLLKWPGLIVSEEITDITGITTELINRYGVAPDRALIAMFCAIIQADYVVAHNGKIFDQKFVNNAVKEHLLTGEHQDFVDMGQTFFGKIWIDTTTDLPVPKRITTRSLKYLAYEHGIFNLGAHRALFDVVTMLNVVRKYDIQEVIDIAKMPSFKLRARASFQQKDLARGAGLYWNAEGKVWERLLKENQLADLIRALDEVGLQYQVFSEDGLKEYSAELAGFQDECVIR